MDKPATHCAVLSNKDDCESIYYGEDIWQLQKNMPKCIVSPEMRQQIATDIAKIFVEWVENGTTYELNLESKDENNCSGDLEKTSSTSSERFLLYDTLGEWMENAFTGESIPADNYGGWFFYLTYGDKVDLYEKIPSIWEKNMTEKELQFYNDKTTKKYSKITNKIIKLSSRLYEIIEKITTTEAYKIGGGTKSL
jgi:hypothetical protein